MPVFQYKAISNVGTNINGKYDAKDKNEVVKMLRENQYHPINIREEIKGNEISFDFLVRVKLKDIAVFCRQFYTMLHSGVTIMNCLDILREETENKKLRRVTSELYESVQKGMTFYEALKKHEGVFPDLLINNGCSR